MGDIVPAVLADNALLDRRRITRERRASTRAPFVASVRSASSTDEEELALAVDLSTSGMRLRRCDAHAAPVAPLVRLEFELPDGGAPVVAAGRLLFESREGRYYASGVRFVDLADEDLLRISQYVAEHG